MNMKPYHSFLMLASTVAFTVLGQLLVKKGMVAVGAAGESKNIAETIIRAFTNLYVIAGLGSALCAAACWLLALSKLPLSHAYPFIAFTFVLVPIGAKLMFGEEISMARWIGIAFIIIGVWLSYR